MKDSNLGYVFADWAGMDDDEPVETPILRKYNYRLETGTVGTNDDNIANLLYNINRMEMRVSYSFSNMEVYDKDMGNLYFMVSDMKVHLNLFLEVFGDKVNSDTLKTVTAALDEAMKSTSDIIDYSCSESPDTAKLCEIFPAVYKKLLAIVPAILALEKCT